MTMCLQKKTSACSGARRQVGATRAKNVKLDENKSGLSTGTYRVRLYIAVYDSNGTFVESANAYSKLKTIS